MNKLCKGCNTEKSLDNFYANHKQKDLKYNKCIPCVTKMNKEYRDNNKEKTRKLSLDYYYKKGREKRQENKDQINKTYRERKRHMRYKIKKYFNLTLDEYNQMFIERDNKCDICNNPESAKHQNGKTRALALDHCHETGKIRGLLCTSCNRGIGLLKDNITLLENAVEYLRKFK